MEKKCKYCGNLIPKNFLFKNKNDLCYKCIKNIVYTEKKYNYGGKEKNKAIFTDNYIIYKNLFCISYDQIEYIAWEDVSKYINGFPDGEDLTLIIELKNGKNIELKETLNNSSVLMQTPVTNLFNNDLRKNKKIEIENAYNNAKKYFYDIYNYIGEKIKERLLKELLIKINSKKPYTIWNLKCIGDKLKKKRIIGKDIEFTYDEMASCGIDEDKVKLKVIKNYKNTEYMDLGTTKSLPNYHLLHAITFDSKIKQYLREHI